MAGKRAARRGLQGPFETQDATFRRPVSSLSRDRVHRCVTRVATLDFDGSRETIVEQAVVGTALYEAVLVALRRLAQEHHSSLRSADRLVARRVNSRRISRRLHRRWLRCSTRPYLQARCAPRALPSPRSDALDHLWRSRRVVGRLPYAISGRNGTTTFAVRGLFLYAGAKWSVRRQ